MYYYYYAIFFLKGVSSKGVFYLSLSIKKILVTIDGSENSKRAAEYAISLAKKYDAELIILYVLYSELGFAYSNLIGVTTPRAIKDVLEAQKKGAVFNQSAGGSFYKKVRRAEGNMEYTAVYQKHLPLPRRIPWKILSLLSNSLGQMYMKRY